jgi:hypothetical protein
VLMMMKKKKNGQLSPLLRGWQQEAGITNRPELNKTVDPGRPISKRVWWHAIDKETP